jgi:hypothetical protein
MPTVKFSTIKTTIKNGFIIPAEDVNSSLLNMPLRPLNKPHSLQKRENTWLSVAGRYALLMQVQAYEIRSFEPAKENNAGGN